MSLIHINPIFVGEIPHEKYFMVHPFTHEFLAFTSHFWPGSIPKVNPKRGQGWSSTCKPASISSCVKPLPSWTRFQADGKSIKKQTLLLCSISTYVRHILYIIYTSMYQSIQYICTIYIYIYTYCIIIFIYIYTPLKTY